MMAAPITIYAFPRRRCYVCRWLWRQRLALVASAMLWTLIVAAVLAVM